MRTLRIVVYIPLAPLLLTSLVSLLQPFNTLNAPFLQRSFFVSLLLLSWSVWLITVCIAPRRIRAISDSIGRVGDVILANVVVTLVIGELAFSLVVRQSSSRLFWDEVSAATTIATQRLQPGETTHGFTHNSGGYYDEEFLAGDENNVVVAVLADSFGAGIVPYSENFTTVMERELKEMLLGRTDRVAINNFGVPGIGMLEYWYLLRTEVEPLKPSLVVLCIFVGNDIEGFARNSRGRFRIQDWWLFRVPQRLVLLNQENMLPRVSLGSENIPSVPSIDHPASTLEQPTYSRQSFDRIELERIQICRTDDPVMNARYEAFWAALDQFVERLGESLVIAVIPDEFQVNDDLYSRLMARVDQTVNFDRYLPQRWISQYCESRDVKLIDLLPKLQEAELIQSAYHLQDTHWNTWGNQVAGRAIAEELTQILRTNAETNSN